MRLILVLLDPRTNLCLRYYKQFFCKSTPFQLFKKRLLFMTMLGCMQRNEYEKFLIFSPVILEVFGREEGHHRYWQWPCFPCASPSRRKTWRRWCSSIPAYRFMTLAASSGKSSSRPATWDNVSFSIFDCTFHTTRCPCIFWFFWHFFDLFLFVLVFKCCELCFLTLKKVLPVLEM